MTKILIVEDQEPIRVNILELLDAQGYSVMGAENGRVAVELAREFLPDLIVCDIIMPELDGHGVLQEVRRNPATSSIPFIFLTAKAEKTDIRQGMNLGADDYLVKPFTQRELLEAISVRLNKHDQFSAHFDRQLEELRNNITASLPHEFLTPLTVILSASEILMLHSDMLTAAEVPQFAERIHTSAERLHRLIRNFLLYSRLELAALDPTKAAFLRGHGSSEVRVVIPDVAARLSQRVNRAEDLHLELSDVTVHMEPIHLSKIVEELLDNAFRYSPPGSAVRLRAYPDDGPVLTLAVVDRGRGMTREQIAQVGAYMQFDRDRYEQQGQGLGLTITKRLIELHGGEMAIESVPHLTTTVRVILPM
jgi:signal transduction histidine kinase